MYIIIKSITLKLSTIVKGMMVGIGKEMIIAMRADVYA